jgi:hypothetical protein
MNGFMGIKKSLSLGPTCGSMMIDTLTLQIMGNIVFSLQLPAVHISVGM